MTDRVPTEILPNGAIRYGIYDETGAFLRYEYIKPEDNPTQEGDAINKGNMLADDTCAALDIPTTSVPNDAFFILSIGNNRGLVEVTVYETGTTTPVPGVVVSGISTSVGATVYTDVNGVATGFTTTSTTALRVSDEYVDLTASAQNISTPFGKKTKAVIYATFKTTQSAQITSSRTIRFARKAAVDVHAVGGGRDGAPGGSGGGVGGQSGGQNFALDRATTASTPYAAVIGAKNGGTSSLLGVNSAANFDAGGRGSDSMGAAAVGESSTVKQFGSGAVVAGGGGGGGGWGTVAFYSTGKAGGAAGGGRGANASNPAVAGGAATAPGGGGGGGGHVDSAVGAGGSGSAGTIWIRWRYV